MQAGNGYWEEPDLIGRVDCHRDRCDHRSRVCSSQHDTDFIFSVMEHQ